MSHLCSSFTYRQLPVTKPNSNKGKHFLSIIKGKEFLPSKPAPILAFVIKGNSTAPSENHLPSVISNLLEEFPNIIEPTTSLPPLRNIQHTIDLMPGSTLPNLSHYRMNPRKYKIT